MYKAQRGQDKNNHTQNKNQYTDGARANSNKIIKNLFTVFVADSQVRTCHSPKQKRINAGIQPQKGKPASNSQCNSTESLSQTFEPVHNQKQSPLTKRLAMVTLMTMAAFIFILVIW